MKCKRYSQTYTNTRIYVIYVHTEKHPSGHMALEQRRNLVEIRSLRCSKLNFDVVPICSGRWDTLTYK